MCTYISIIIHIYYQCITLSLDCMDTLKIYLCPIFRICGDQLYVYIITWLFWKYVITHSEANLFRAFYKIASRYVTPTILTHTCNCSSVSSPWLRITHQTISSYVTLTTITHIPKHNYKHTCNTTDSII